MYQERTSLTFTLGGPAKKNWVFFSKSLFLRHLQNNRKNIYHSDNIEHIVDIHVFFSFSLSPTRVKSLILAYFNISNGIKVFTWRDWDISFFRLLLPCNACMGAINIYKLHIYFFPKEKWFQVVFSLHKQVNQVLTKLFVWKCIIFFLYLHYTLVDYIHPWSDWAMSGLVGLVCLFYFH